MVNRLSRTGIVSGIWLAGVAGLIACSVAMGASVATSSLVLVVGASSMGVALLIGLGAPSPTVAEVLYAVNKPREGRP